MTRAFLSMLLAAGVALTSVATPTLAADSWPNRPIRLIVPFQAGSATDLISRQLSEALGQELGQPIVVEARPGAGAVIGATQVARAEPDGYTLLMGGPAAVVTNRYLHKKLSYDPDAFELVSMVADTPNILLTNTEQPFKTLPAMIAYAKANPGKLTYASFGAGTTSHLAGEMLRSVAGIDILHVPYKGAGEAIPALISGQVSLYFDTIMTGLPHTQSGRLVALGLSTAERAALAPQIPTIAEQGYAGYDIAPWYGVVAPAGTPEAVLERLNGAINKVLAADALRAKLAQAGAQPRGGSRQQFADFIKAEIPRTRQLVEQAGLTAQ